MVAFLNANERAFLQAVSAAVYCNPFLPERIAYERTALGRAFIATEAHWNMRGDDTQTPHVNPLRLAERGARLLENLRRKLYAGTAASEQDLALYEDAVLFVLFYRYSNDFYTVILAASAHRAGACGFYTSFLDDFMGYFDVPGFTRPTRHEAAHLFACCFQVRRAFHHIFRHIIGGSHTAARLRATVSESIFTHDMRRYRRSLYTRMGDFSTLITGPSGSGKELVARAIGLSRYIPFDPGTKRFSEDFTASFHALNLSALPTTLIESELFGHRRGAFTGALRERRGWLETCKPLGTIFLDEIGDLEAAVQVKLLRVIQTRTFQPLGDTIERHFAGKLIAATNRDLVTAMQQGAFREDLYYRLCSDLITTPSLHEQLRESPRVLPALLLFIAQRLVDDAAQELAAEAEDWIVQHLGPDYSWPGNIRELEQCLRNVLIRKAYHPPRRPAPSAFEAFMQAIESGSLSAEEVLRGYCTLVFAQTGSYLETARRLQLDRRTVKAKIDSELPGRMRAET